MKKLILNSWRFVFFIILISATSSCLEDKFSEPIPWIEGEGTVSATNVSLDFNGLLIWKSSTEVHSYYAKIKDKVVEGTFEVYNFDIEGKPVSDAQGDIESIVFERDCKTARITGIITKGSDPTYLGLYAVWTVIANGSDINETSDIRYPVDPETAKYHRDGGLSMKWYGFTSFFSANNKVKLQSKGCN
ncbi:hypothetical protein U3A58_08370 [Algoriphagus sp. C2-6-M1]|uniref:hypothetical protein n=1 Tax=Algoriphagus persicinus TaxID=3108754 RepID=UPI002B3AA66B|nr:hypothetical protein [Algoriphagus sp. C2-6-M1]MEB2780407.1 hypothetical protein [Algoriphagus sp. C2-6-M1]